MVKKIINCLGKSTVNLIHHDGVEHAGYMAFLSLLSFFPFLVLLVSIASFIGNVNLGVTFQHVFLSNLPDNVALALKPRIQELISGPPTSLMTLAIVGSIWTASSSVEGWRTILNRVYNISAPPAYILRRLLSIAQFLLLTASIIFLMLVLVVVPIIWAKFAHLFEFIAILDPLWNYIRYGTIFVALLIFVASLYFVIPNAKLKLKEVIPGSILTVILWIGSGITLSYYLSNFQQVSFVYGGLAGIIVTLIFFYIINIIFIYGAEFNYLYHKPINQ